jgi:hypothetical protein
MLGTQPLAKRLVKTQNDERNLWTAHNGNAGPRTLRGPMRMFRPRNTPRLTTATQGLERCERNARVPHARVGHLTTATQGLERCERSKYGKFSEDRAAHNGNAGPRTLRGSDGLVSRVGDDLTTATQGLERCEYDQTLKLSAAGPLTTATQKFHSHPKQHALH